MQPIKSFIQVIGSLTLAGLLLAGGLFALQSASSDALTNTPSRETATTETAPPPYPLPNTPPPDKTLPPPPAPTWDYANPPTMPPATPKPITYSITSTEDWMTYTNPDLGLILKYPENAPRVDQDQAGDYEWSVLNLFIRTGPTVPANSSNKAVLIFTVHPNPERLSLIEAIKNVKANYGELEVVEREADPIPQHLLRAGAEEARAVNSDWGTLYAATHGERLYILGQGFMTQSEGQYQVFELVVTTLQFVGEN